MHLSLRTVKHGALCAILFVMPLRSTLLSPASRLFSTFPLAENPRVQSTLDWFQTNQSWITEQQIRLTEIPAPSFQEERRAEAVKGLLTAEGLAVHIDKLGNVTGELVGAGPKEAVLVTAHLDTVFPAGTRIKVQREGKRLLAPGISDNG